MNLLHIPKDIQLKVSNYVHHEFQEETSGGAMKRGEDILNQIDDDLKRDV